MRWLEGVPVFERCASSIQIGSVVGLESRHQLYSDQVVLLTHSWIHISNDHNVRGGIHSRQDSLFRSNLKNKMLGKIDLLGCNGQ